MPRAHPVLGIVLDNLIEQGDIPPLVAALVQSRDRIREYARGRRHARALVKKVLPALEARYALSGDVRYRVIDEIYHAERMHSALRYQSPAKYEEKHARLAA